MSRTATIIGMVTSIIAFGFSSTTQAANLTAYYDFEDDYNDAPGAGINPDDLTPQGQNSTGPQFQVDVSPNALGSTKSVHFSNTPSVPGVNENLQSDAFSTDLGPGPVGDSWTIMTWIKGDNTLLENTNTRIISTKNGGGPQNWQIEGPSTTDPDVDIRIQPGAGGTNLIWDDPNVLSNDGWHHLAFVYSDAGGPGGNAYTETYLDGNSLGQDARALENGLANHNTTGELRVGTDSNGFGTRDFTGSLDDLALFEGVVSSADILAIASGNLSPADFLPQDSAATPEPSTILLYAFGVLSLGIVGWRRRRR